MTITRLVQRAALATTFSLSLVSAPTRGFAQAAAPAPAEEAAPQVDNGKQVVVGVINADAVIIRSGAGESYYPTMKLDKGAKVTVVGHKLGWLKIIPPEGSFSYIGKAFVTRNGDGTSGKVNGDEVRVRAGSTMVELVSIVQAQLNTGAQVQIVGEKNEFFVIKPPAGAYVFVSEKYVDPAPAAEQPGNKQPIIADAGTPTQPPTDAGQTPVENAGTGAPPTDPTAAGPTTAPAPTGELAQAPTTQPGQLSVDAEFEKLEADFVAMSEKKIEDQPIAEMVTSYQKLIASAQLPESLKRVADVRVKMLGIRGEAKDQYLAMRKVQDESTQRQTALKAEKEELEEQIKRTEVKMYAAVGVLQMSSLQNGKAMLYRLTDPTTQRTVVYVRTNDSAKFGAMLGKFIGVKGEVTTEQQLSMRVVVPTDAEEVDPNAMYRSIAAEVVPPSMLPRTANVPAAE